MKKVVVGIIVIIALAGAAAAGYWYYFLREEISQSNTVKPPTAQEKADKIVAEAAQSEGGDVSKQADKLKDLADKTSKSEDKETYLSSAIDVYSNAGNDAAAFSVAKEYEDTSSSALSAAALARSYYAKGDYKNAAKYYGIAADRSEKPASSNERAPYNDYIILKREAESHF